MFPFLVGEALRDLRRAGRVGLAAILLITLSLGALGCFCCSRSIWAAR